MSKVRFQSLSVYSNGYEKEEAEFVTSAFSQSFDLNAQPDPLHKLTENPAFDFWKNPEEDVYEDA